MQNRRANMVRWAVICSAIAVVTYASWIGLAELHAHATCRWNWGQPPVDTTVMSDPILGIVLGTPICSEPDCDANYFIANLGAGNARLLARGEANSDMFAHAQNILGAFGHRGLAIEPGSDDFKELVQNLPHEGILKLNEFATPLSIVGQLEQAKAPKKMRAFKIDIDSYDLDVVAAVLKAGYSPSFIQVEYNEKVPPPIVFAVHYDKKLPWNYHGILDDGHCYGASLQAWVNLLTPKGYDMVMVEWNDILFVKKELSDVVKRLYPDSRATGFGLSASDAYKAGYSERYCRDKHFTWNKDVKHWITEANAGPAGVSRARAQIKTYMLNNNHIKASDQLPSGYTAVEIA